ncbi:MAG TPA: DUF1835 domain-containing protein [Pyrinomonadaceae bacterium]
MTLHIVNGDSTAGTLKVGGIKGAIFSFADALISGPAPANIDRRRWRETRATHLSNLYGTSFAECQRKLLQQEVALESFCQHEEVVLWFEHDLFCQLNLLSLLAWFGRVEKGRTRLSLINIGSFPGRPDFRGLGELNPDELLSLFPTRQAVNPNQLRLAADAWNAFCSPDPTRIEDFVKKDVSEITFLSDAFNAHLRRFPSVTNGLGHVEKTALTMVQNGVETFVDIFLKFGDLAAVYGLGDLQVWLTLISLTEGKKPLLRLEQVDHAGIRRIQASPRARFVLTDDGHDVLSGTADYARLNDFDIWLGGAHLTNSTLWRWDEDAKKLEYQQDERNGH